MSANETHWYITDGSHRFLTIGALHSRAIDYAFIEGKDAAEKFTNREAALDFLSWMRPYTDPPYKVVDYIDPVDPGPLHTEPGPSRAELISEALAADRERYKIRLHKEFAVVNKWG